jgi:hypothetical protein
MGWWAVPTLLDFELVLPGHGRRHHADKATLRQQMQKCLAWMKAQ